MRNLNLFFYSLLSLFIVSCEGAYEEIGEGSSNPSNPITSITLSVSAENVAINNEVTFQVLSDKNDVITSSCKFFVNDKEIVGNKYTPGEEGSFSVYATYNALKSNIKNFTASVEALNFKTNVLVEDYTGAWCGYCPRVAYKLKELEKKTSQLITVAVHNGDKFEYSKESTMRNAFSVSGFPTAMVNRTTKWNESDSQVLNAVSSSSKVGLLIESSLSGSTIKVKVKAKFGITYTDLKLGVFLLEDDLIEDQRNYADFGYGAADPLIGFEHDNVLRVSLTDPLGDAIASSSTENGDVFEKEFTYEIPTAYNKDKMKIVVFITKNDKTSLNARVSDIGTTQTFEGV